MKKLFPHYLMLWLILAIVCSAVAGVVYVTVQQNLRQSANDPQIQMAEDTATDLSDGLNPTSFETAKKIDIATSLAPYLIIYDRYGKIIASTGQLDGNPPVVPEGVLKEAGQWGENRVTWQPRFGVRSAIVAVPFNNQAQSGFVVVGRSLREIEIRENQLEFLVGFFWIFSLVVIFVLILFSYLISRFGLSRE